MLALSDQQLKAVIHTASMLSPGRHGQTVLKAWVARPPF